MNNHELAQIYEDAADYILIHGLAGEENNGAGPNDSLCVVRTLCCVAPSSFLFWVNGAEGDLLRSKVPNECVVTWSDTLAEQPDGWATVRDTLLEVAKDLRNDRI